MAITTIKPRSDALMPVQRRENSKEDAFGRAGPACWIAAPGSGERSPGWPRGEQTAVPMVSRSMEADEV